MADQEKNVPIEQDTPETPAQTKVPETPETRVQKQRQDSLEKISEFKKDVKFLWIYGTIFCLVLLALIGASYLIQQKLHAEMDEYKNQNAEAQVTIEQNKSRLSAIQEENANLKSKAESLQQENESLKAAAEADEALINSAEQIILEQQKLLKVARLYQEGKKREASELFESIDKTLLPQDSMESYTHYEERLK